MGIRGFEYVSLGLQIPSKKVLWGVFRGLSTFLEGIWSPRVWVKGDKWYVWNGKKVKAQISIFSMVIWEWAFSKCLADFFCSPGSLPSRPFGLGPGWFHHVERVPEILFIFSMSKDYSRSRQGKVLFVEKCSDQQWSDFLTVIYFLLSRASSGYSSHKMLDSDQRRSPKASVDNIILSVCGFLANLRPCWGHRRVAWLACCPDFVDTWLPAEKASSIDSLWLKMNHVKVLMGWAAVALFDHFNILVEHQRTTVKGRRWMSMSRSWR